MTTPFAEPITNVKRWVSERVPGLARKVKAGRPERSKVISHWHLLVDEFNTSALEFYTALEGVLAERKLPHIRVGRVEWKEGGLFSAKREYLQVSLDRVTYDICAAPYGTGYFFSSWMAVKEPIPILDRVLSLFGRRAATYYTLDTRLMFRESVHRAVTDTISTLRTAKGLRALSPDEARPAISDPLA